MSTQRLHTAVQNAYRVFARHRAPAHPLNVCIGCCMSPKLEQEMRTLPLCQLGPNHFTEYADGAKSASKQGAAEIKYLLPRWLELLAEGHELRHSLEITLDRVGNCPPDSFNDTERTALDAFMLAFFDARMSGQIQRDGRWFWAEPMDLLLMADYAGLDVLPLLTHWTAMAHPQATLGFVTAVYWDYLPKGEISAVFAGDRLAFKTKMRAWLEAPEIKAAFARKLMEPDFLTLVAQHPPYGRTPIALMVDAVFDHLAN